MTKADDMAAAPPDMTLSSIWWAARNPPSDPTPSFRGKTVLVTGANTGLGYEAALKFARLGASKIILGVRSLEKGEHARSRIAAELGSSSFDPTAISVHQIDMLDYASIRAFTDEVSEKYSEIHIAVLNAGIGVIKHVLSPQGYELSVQVNGIATAYAALLLLPKLCETSEKEGQPSVLEIVASQGHAGTNPSMLQTEGSLLKHISEEKNFSLLGQYNISKLLNMWTMRQLAARVPAEQVTVLTVCPGLCKSDMARDGPWLLRQVDGLWKSICGRTAEEGGRTLVSGAAVGVQSHGGWWTNDRISVPSPMVTSAEGQALSDKFWGEIMDIFKDESPEVLEFA